MLTRRRLRAVLASAAGAVFFLVLGMPLPLLLGPMAGCLVVSLAGFRLQDLGKFGIFVRTFLGVAIGTTFTPEIAANIPDMARSLVFIPPFILMIGLTGFLLFRRIGFDRQTAFYAAMPGGLQDMIILGEQAGGNVRAMSLVHATRVLVIFTLVPFAITLFWGLDLTGPPGNPATDVPVAEIAIMVLAGIGGWQIAARIGIPGPSFLGPLILTACCTLAGLINSRPPVEMILMAQFIIGLAVGARYSGITAEELKKYVVAGVAYTAIIGAMSVMLIVIVVRALGLEPMDALLSFLPGGQPEMAVIALASGADIAFVATHHILRILLVILFAQAFSGWLRRH